MIYKLSETFTSAQRPCSRLSVSGLCMLQSPLQREFCCHISPLIYYPGALVTEESTSGDASDCSHGCHVMLKPSECLINEETSVSMLKHRLCWLCVCGRTFIRIPKEGRIVLMLHIKTGYSRAEG